MNWTRTLLAMTAGLCCCQLAIAGTILKLGFSNDALADVELMSSELTTVDDNIGATVGDQNTEATFLGALSSQPAIAGPNASVTIDGVALDGQASLIGNFMVQQTSGGTFSLYDQNNALLLEGGLGEGTITGPIGGTATGSFLTTDFGAFTGGTLLPLLQGVTEASWSVSLSNVKSNTGNGFATTNDGSLADFKADATANIAAPDVPEPTSIVMMLLGMGAIGFFYRKSL